MSDKVEELRRKKREILELAREKQRQLDEQIKLIEAAQNKRARKLEDRKKLLEGVALRAWVARGKMSQEEYRQLLEEGLTLDRDRKLFGLAPRGAASAEQLAAAASPEPPEPQTPSEPQEGSQTVQETPGKGLEGPIYLQTTFADRIEVKALGARWDDPKRAWYVPAGLDVGPFARWLPSEAASPSPGVQDQASPKAARGQKTGPAHSSSEETPAAQPSRPAAPAASETAGAPAGERRKEERRKRSEASSGGTERRKGERRRSGSTPTAPVPESPPSP